MSHGFLLVGLFAHSFVCSSVSVGLFVCLFVRLLVVCLFVLFCFGLVVCLFVSIVISCFGSFFV